MAGWFFAVGTTPFLWFFVIHGVLSGAFMTGTASLGQRILPRDRFAQFASAGGMITSVGIMFMQPLAGLIIDATGQNYRHTFLMNGILSLAALACYLLFYRAWKARGGDSDYKAP
jgi:MFS family permease